jgi:HSP20 family molecular chaperone IbpA
MAAALTRWDPFAEIAELRSRLDRLFDEPGGHPQGAWRPAIDVMRRDDTLVVRADLPGLTPDEVKIEVEDGVLTVSGEHQEDRSDSVVAAMSAVSVASAPSRGRSSCPPESMPRRSRRRRAMGWSRS